MTSEQRQETEDLIFSMLEKISKVVSGPAPPDDIEAVHDHALAVAGDVLIGGDDTACLSVAAAFGYVATLARLLCSEECDRLLDLIGSLWRQAFRDALRMSKEKAEELKMVGSEHKQAQFVAMYIATALGIPEGIVRTRDQARVSSLLSPDGGMMHMLDGLLGAAGCKDCEDKELCDEECGCGALSLPCPEGVN